eukprot:GILI01009330.1.p1 GENE.GILI01009330.1~~GILI01009330.1.p1  ORF type:complete len:220 (+),score=71.74 GILI01009330.1:77-736(+)
MELKTVSSTVSHAITAAHCAFFCRDIEKTPLYGPSRTGTIFMQMRFDGLIGFPGGLIDAGESAVEGIAREVREETGFMNFFPTEAHILSLDEESGNRFYLFSYEMRKDDFMALERSAFEGPDYGLETLGLVRVPLFVSSKCPSKGLPAFLNHAFAGHAKRQLIVTILRHHLMSHEDLLLSVKGDSDLTDLVNEHILLGSGEAESAAVSASSSSSSSLSS